MFAVSNSEITISLGKFVDDTDGKTAETGLAGSMTVYLVKDGAASVARHSTTAISHDRAGRYLVHLDSDDLDFVGPLTVFADPAGALGCKRELFVVNADFYLAMGMGGPLQADLVSWDGDADPVTNGAAFLGSAAAMTNITDFFDGTGYDAANSTIGTVTDLTNAPAANGDMTKIAGSTTAASNLKKLVDGTGLAMPTSSLGSVGSVSNTVNANLTNVNGTAALMTAFVNLMRGAIVGTVVAGTNTATVISTGLAATTANLYAGKMLMVTTGARAGEGGKLVTAYDGTTKRLTVEALSGALSVGDTFVLVG